MSDYTQRAVLQVIGDDTRTFLQDLITNDIHRLSQGLLYSAILTPQGKYLSDFFLLAVSANEILLDIKSEMASDLMRRLRFYKLRARVDIGLTDINVSCGIRNQPAGAMRDPRHAELGWRSYQVDVIETSEQVDWDHLRVTHGIPETGIELIPEKTFILEMGFERLNGVDFKKGCFVGQEVTARMKHKTELRRQLKTVHVDGHASVGTPIHADGRAVGTLFSQARGKGLAHLRMDRLQGVQFQAGDATIHLA